MSIYDYNANDAMGNSIPMSKYQGKVLLVVNTATGCGFTPQYEDLQHLYDRYQEQGLEILDFPCNQFMNQAPGSDGEIVSFCQLNYGTTFQTFAKVEVNGANAHPLFQYLRKETKGVLGDKIKWNFTKFLIDRDGNVVKRYAPTVKPASFEEDIKSLL